MSIAYPAAGPCVHPLGSMDRSERLLLALRRKLGPSPLRAQRPYTAVVRSFVGSLFALILGAFLVFSGLRGYPFAMDSLVGGATMILGALAYRSAKQRRLGLRPDTRLRRVLEIAVVVLVSVPLVILAAEGNDAIWFYPWSGIVVPASTLLAFLWILTRKNVKTADNLPSIR